MKRQNRWTCRPALALWRGGIRPVTERPFSY